MKVQALETFDAGTLSYPCCEETEKKKNKKERYTEIAICAD